jgi:hypothetical protein
MSSSNQPIEELERFFDRPEIRQQVLEASKNNDSQTVVQIAERLANVGFVGRDFNINFSLDQINSAAKEATEKAQIYQKYVTDLLSDLANPKKGLPIPDKSFHLTFSSEGSQKQDVDLLADFILKNTRVLLLGNAGGGKSGIVRKCAEKLIESNEFPIVLNFKRWKEKINEADRGRLIDADTSYTDKFDILCKTAVTDTDLGRIEKLPKQIILADALNEIYDSQDVQNIILILDEYVRKNAAHDVCVLITDRAKQSYYDSDWLVADLNLLELKDVRDNIIERFDENSFNELTDSERELLRTPFFLNIALDKQSASPRLGSAADAINNYFLNNLKVSADELNKLAEAAFEAYRSEHAVSFSIEKFRGKSGETAFNKLVEANVIIATDDHTAKFDHQLKHDFLASKYLADNQKVWAWDAFDKVTFKSKSLEPLFMAMEQLPDQDQAGNFLKKIYDWNWKAPLRCLQHDEETNKGLLSDEIKIALLALNAEKIFDPVIKTSQKAREQIEKISSDFALKFLEADSPEKLREIVSAYPPESEWFNTWQNLFIRSAETELSESDLQMIISPDPILGWTASNVIRRFDLCSEDFRQLSAYLHLSFELENENVNSSGNTIQWRLVHALGKFEDRTTLDLLFHTLSRSGYNWAKYGAVRSLIEIAAFTANENTRTEIIEKIEGQLNNLESNTLEEICNTAIYRDPFKGWATKFKPIFEKIKTVVRDKQIDSPQRADNLSRIENIEKDFDNYYQAAVNKN